MATQHSESVKNPTSRVAEMVLGIAGGIFGIIAGLFAIFLEVIAQVVTESEGGFVVLGTACIVVSILAIIFSCIINKSRILFGIIILICGVLNIVFVSYFGILSGILIGISGLLALIRK
ncbi:FtsH-binding integral membrane protein [Scopulibacillus daqui]|uniref:FtsH-binding integral membrane protein n=1 Tax=Scopulibacillus daqui TaxID=1469162 RepID=A0ABS2Q124_9BACL|nr:DUF4064 domain-containing protein [Scopulibacillus daqui]MBM7645893.1 FtsH-binding integral membrane protein [Scopulibacillus daqui]